MSLSTEPLRPGDMLHIHCCKAPLDAYISFFEDCAVLTAFWRNKLKRTARTMTHDKAISIAAKVLRSGGTVEVSP